MVRNLICHSITEIELAPDVLRKGESSRNAPQSDASGLNVQERCYKRKGEYLVEPRQLHKKPKVDYRRLNNPFADERDEIHELIFTSAEVIYAVFAEQSLGNNDEPKTLGEARASLEWPEWEKVVQIELQQLKRMGTWELVDKPPDSVPIANKWVLTKKFNKDGKLVKYKARLVAKGFAQRPGQDYNETFSPVVRLETIRAILALVPAKNLNVQQMDVKGAYLNGYLKESVYMCQPDGYDDGTGRICHLVKTLYGLKQAGHEWNKVLDHKLKAKGFEPLLSDPCAYI